MLVFSAHKLPANASTEYDQAWQSFIRGDLARCQFASEVGYERFRIAKPGWASEFKLLQARTLVWRGIYDDALRLLDSYDSPSNRPQAEIEKLALVAVALTHQQKPGEANQALIKAESFCKTFEYESCGDVFVSRGILLVDRGKFPDARVSFLNALAFARSHQNKFLEAYAASNLGWTALQTEHFDEATDWLNLAYRIATSESAGEIAGKVIGNLGWAYFNLGDGERALNLYLAAETSAAQHGSIRSQVGWINAAGYVYRNTGDLKQASLSYNRALNLAKKINSKEDILNSLEDLANISIDLGNFEEAELYINEVRPIVQASGNRLDALVVMLAQARMAKAQHEAELAESLFRTVDRDPASQTSMRMASQHGLAQLYQLQSNEAAADHMFRTALATFESARNQLKNEDSKLPFRANATDIYDDYIHFLIDHNRSDEALQVADQSRAQTLAQGLGISSSSLDTRRLRPNEVARKTGATLLFYWLGEKQSYMWTITATKTSLYKLPAESEIGQSIKRYRKALLGLGDPADDSNPDGLALYRLLIHPAESLVQPTAKLVILSDGELSQLNFETLIVPGPHPHYLIEDATISSAPSLQLLASATSSSPASKRLLLLGDSISPNPDYPDLPMAASEMKQISQQFDPRSETVIAREKANPAAYLAANPQHFAYIHFVAHGVASRTDPLDSAIILSRSSAAEDSFKLHARDIIQHPIQAKLVTVSACYGTGTRSYAGEGSIGLAWAFLRAGAHNVIGALWEVSDESTPQLMGDLYRAIGQGLRPSAALRQAKLAMLHSHGEFRKPFYWAPLQIYSGL